VSNRSLVTAVAVLAAVLVALPILLTKVGRLPVDTAGLIVNALVALGTFYAAGAAVWVAISGRTQLKDERDAEDRAQARLVFVDVNPGASHIRVTVRNYGDRSILDVTYENVRITAFPPALFVPPMRAVQVVVPNRDSPPGGVLEVHAADEPTREFMQSWFPPAGRPGASPVSATVSFTDASDNRWQTTFGLQGQLAKQADGTTVTLGSMCHVSLERA
jgi:archaellum component FlaF (FlaF/FlaG flagellin family)